MDITLPISQQPIPDNAKKVFSGLLFDIYQWEQKQFDGSTKTFEKIKRQDTAGVLAITKDKKILMLSQEQPGTELFLGTPGGIIDKGEAPLEAAKRELLEETGYRGDSWELFQATQPASKIDWTVFTFIARDCVKIDDPHLDSGERIEVKEITWQEFLETIVKETFRDKELTLTMLRQLHKPGGEEKLKQQILGV